MKLKFLSALLVVGFLVVPASAEEHVEACENLEQIEEEMRAEIEEADTLEERERVEEEYSERISDLRDECYAESDSQVAEPQLVERHQSCREAVELEREMEQKMEEADTSEKRRDIAADYRERIEEQRRECAEQRGEYEEKTAEDAIEWSRDYPRTSTPSFSEANLTDEELERVKDNILEAMDSFRDEVPASITEECVERAADIMEENREDISEAESLEEVVSSTRILDMEMENLIQKRECRDVEALEEDRYREAPDSDQAEERRPEVPNIQKRDISLPEPGERVSEEQVNELRLEFTEMERELEEYRTRVSQLEQQVEKLRERLSEESETGEEENSGRDEVARPQPEPDLGEVPDGLERDEREENEENVEDGLSEPERESGGQESEEARNRDEADQENEEQVEEETEAERERGLIDRAAGLILG